MVDAISGIEAGLEHGTSVEMDALAQARILARYYRTLIDEGVPTAMAEDLTRMWQSHLKTEKFWVRSAEAATRKEGT